MASTCNTASCVNQTNWQFTIVICIVVICVTVWLISRHWHNR